VLEEGEGRDRFGGAEGAVGEGLEKKRGADRAGKGTVGGEVEIMATLLRSLLNLFSCWTPRLFAQPIL